MAEKKPKTVLLVCMVDSVHVAKWISQFDPDKVSFVLFASGPNRRIHPLIPNRTRSARKKSIGIEVHPFGGLVSLPLWAIDKFLGDRLRGALLRRLITKINPDYIHALEFQHSGYLANRALKDSAIDTAFIATNYGSDIFWFQRFPNHRQKIKGVLERADFYSAECKRDYDLAKELGYQKELLPLIPNAGGLAPYDSDANPQTTSARRIIAIKGYQGWVGRANVVLEALEIAAESLKSFQVVMFSSNSSSARLARRISRRSNLRIKVYKKGALSNTQVKDFLAQSRVYVGASLSDGISTTFLEAMSAGAFPVQTNTACVSEWVEDGHSALLIKKIEVGEISSAIIRACTDDTLVDHAQRVNRETIAAMASPETVKKLAQSFYGLG